MLKFRNVLLLLLELFLDYKIDMWSTLVAVLTAASSCFLFCPLLFPFSVMLCPFLRVGGQRSVTAWKRALSVWKGLGLLHCCFTLVESPDVTVFKHICDICLCTHAHSSYIRILLPVNEWTSSYDVLFDTSSCNVNYRKRILWKIINQFSS